MKQRIDSSFVQYTLTSFFFLHSSQLWPHSLSSKFPHCFLFSKQQAFKRWYLNKTKQSTIRQGKSLYILLDKATQQEKISSKSRQKSQRYTYFHCLEFHKNTKLIASTYFFDQHAKIMLYFDMFIHIFCNFSPLFPSSSASFLESVIPQYPISLLCHISCYIFCIKISL